MKHEGWSILEVLGLSLDARAYDRLERFEAELLARAVPMGMISKGDVPRLRERHLLDCLRALPLLDANDRRLCDLGSGAGLPGVPLAIADPTRLRLPAPSS